MFVTKIVSKVMILDRDCTLYIKSIEDYEKFLILLLD